MKTRAFDPETNSLSYVWRRNRVGTRRRGDNRMKELTVLKYVCKQCSDDGCELFIKYPIEDAVYRGEPDTCPLTGSKAAFKEV